MELDEGTDDEVTIANTRCVEGQFPTVELRPVETDCRTYSMRRQELDQATGTFNMVLRVGTSRCDAARVCLLLSDQRRLQPHPAYVSLSSCRDVASSSARS